MKYKATLVLPPSAPTLERPVQIFGGDVPGLEKWADGVLSKSVDGAVVKVVEMMEKPLLLIRKRGAEAHAGSIRT